MWQIEESTKSKVVKWRSSFRKISGVNLSLWGNKYRIVEQTKKICWMVINITKLNDHRNPKKNRGWLITRIFHFLTLRISFNIKIPDYVVYLVPPYRKFYMTYLLTSLTHLFTYSLLDKLGMDFSWILFSSLHLSFIDIIFRRNSFKINTYIVKTSVLISFVLNEITCVILS